MQRHAFLLVVCGVFVCAFGCGPLRVPMAPRVDDDTQKRIDEAWENALAPTDRFDHQLLLDVLIGTGVYQRGVDKLTFRSEKRFSGGTVVMEIMFDRAEPDKDRFEVTISDKGGKQLRKEVYGREEVEKTYRELFDFPPTRQEEDKNPEPPELIRRRQEFEARWRPIEKLFPRLKEEPIK
jgi:hypothetical protein